MIKKFLNFLRKYNFIIILLSIVFSQEALGEAPKKLLILGDSISAGYGVSVDRQWTSILQRKLDSSGKSPKTVMPLQNSSVSGSCTNKFRAPLEFT